MKDDIKNLIKGVRTLHNDQAISMLCDELEKSIQFNEDTLAVKIKLHEDNQSLQATIDGMHETLNGVLEAAGEDWQDVDDLPNVIKRMRQELELKSASGYPVTTSRNMLKSDLLQRAEKLAEETAALAQRVQCEDLRAQVRAEHAEWAQATFGNTGPVGPLKHLSAEALEAAAEPSDLSEWADMQFLFWDAQRKAGFSDEQITQAMVAKLQVNKARQWPEPKEGEPRFHIKDGE